MRAGAPSAAATEASRLSEPGDAESDTPESDCRLPVRPAATAASYDPRPSMQPRLSRRLTATPGVRPTPGACGRGTAPDRALGPKYHAAVERRRLPTGIQTFRRIREEGYYYVDKTAYARRLADDAGKHYFLSRPRRFGKSLFLDTLKALYEGAEELFRGLAVHDGWDWSRRCPVVRLDFAGGNYKRPGALLARVGEQLQDIERETGTPSSAGATAPGRLVRLLAALHRRTGRRVVVLVDEYDKPIVDALHDAPETAKANRDDLRGLYGALKACDAHVELAFLTGVSRFSKVSLFSDLNFLTDLTLNPRYSAVCGYTEADLDTVFAPELPGLDRDLVRAWYNGYNWRGSERVYNPWAILHLFASREFEAHWFETATPRFLVDTLIRRGFAAPDLENVHASAALLSAFDVDAIAPEALLFQTGYLTIAAEETAPDGPPRFRLGYPNREVRRGLNESLLDALAPDWRRTEAAEGNGAELRRVLAAEDWTGLEALFRRLLAGIPHDWHRRNDIARYEGYWSSVFYAFFQASVDGVSVEDATSRGRLDLAVKLDGNAYLFEFKVAERSGSPRRPRPDGAGSAPPRTEAGAEVDRRPRPDRGAPPRADAGAGGDPVPTLPGPRRDPSEETAALAQLKARRYADKYRAPDCSVHLIGVEISAGERDIASLEVEAA